MTFSAWFGYVGVVLLFMCTPGPSHLLMFSMGMQHGFRRALLTAAGDLTANAIQMTLAGLGLASALMASQLAFAVVKWLGVLYLAYMGLRLLFGSTAATAEKKVAASRLWAIGFLTSAANPKAVVFFAALFPQFIQPSAPFVPQLLVLGSTYLVIDGLFLTFYGRASVALAQRLAGPRRRLLNRVAGAGMLGTALLLGLKSVRSH